MKLNLHKNWWIVPVEAAIVGLLAIFLADQFFENLQTAAVFLFLLLVGLSFMWAFSWRGIWWAVAPGVGLLTVCVIIIVSLFIPENNGWVASLILGAGALVIGAIPNPRVEMKIAYVIAPWMLVIGFLISPLPLALRIVLAVASILFVIYLIWRNLDKFKAMQAT
jgi:hypothetical protein